MGKREIILFTYGDSNSIDTWSNVPYFLGVNIEKLGIVVHRVDIGIHSSGIIGKFILRCFYFVTDKLIKITKSPSYGFFRSYIYRKMVIKKIKKAIEAHPTCSEYIITNFDYGLRGLKRGG